ncbi:MAG: hypothetical protein C4527_20455 [Candidatus Omnitrophota bacterium]|jgi:hypothetical protein|nr:MAG: hypothetical protein C4527_20455 [Candidatus Omnitrophota bacterium]
MQNINRLKTISLIVPLVVFVISVFTLEFTIRRETGRVIYPIDDAYIHLAMARHFAADGMLGVSQAGFSAATSSPGWTLLLGFSIRLFGNHAFLPLFYNCLFAAMVVIWLTVFLQTILQNAFHTAISLVFMIFVLPLPTLTCTGMEHPLHILLIILLVTRTVGLLATKERRISIAELFLLGMMATLVRYETVFVVMPLCLLLLVHGKKHYIVALVGSCALPIVLFGVLYVLHDWFFLPTSILKKSAMQNPGWSIFGDLFNRLFGQLFGERHIVVPFLLVLVSFLWKLRNGDAWTTAAGLFDFVFLTACMLHCSCASLGWFYRYEGYLLTLGFMALTPLLRDALSAAKPIWANPTPFAERWLVRGILIAVALLFLVPFSHQVKSIGLIVPGARNLFSQQYQMGLFLREFYEGKTIVANDIGVINYLADIRCLDLMGLGSVEPLRAAFDDIFSPVFVHNWCMKEDAVIAVVYESWWRGLLPPHWRKVGEWTVNEKVTVADPTVSFYAIPSSEIDPLKIRLSEFRKKLPAGVSVNLF